jgi:hypothetical protein
MTLADLQDYLNYSQKREYELYHSHTSSEPESQEVPPIAPSTMQVDSPRAPLPRAPDHDVNANNVNASAHLEPLDNVYSLDDFLAAHKPEDNASTSRSPAAKKQKSSSSAPQGVENGVPVPVAVSARSSRNTILVHEMYQAYGVDQPIYTFGGSSVEGWSVAAVFLDREFVAKGPFPSKQEAKEVVSGKIMEVVDRMVEEGSLVKKGKGKKKKVLGGEGGVPVPVERKKDVVVVNYTGQLLGIYNPFLPSLPPFNLKPTLINPFSTSRVPTRNLLPTTNLHRLHPRPILLLHRDHRRPPPTLRLHLHALLLEKGSPPPRRKMRNRLLQGNRRLARISHGSRRYQEEDCCPAAAAGSCCLGG